MSVFNCFFTGFSGAFVFCVPYLKGIYLTLKSWRLGRDTNDWPLMEYKRDGNGICHDDLTPPLLVTMVPWFKLYMHALLMLTCCKDPPELSVQSKSKNATYIVGDAPGTGFGLCCWTQRTEVVRVEFWKWIEEVELGELSNFREAGNLVVQIIRMASTCKIAKGTEIFVFTDSKVMERIYLQGLSV